MERLTWQLLLPSSALHPGRKMLGLQLCCCRPLGSRAALACVHAAAWGWLAVRLRWACSSRRPQAVRPMGLVYPCWISVPTLGPRSLGLLVCSSETGLLRLGTAWRDGLRQRDSRQSVCHLKHSFSRHILRTSSCISLVHICGLTAPAYTEAAVQPRREQRRTHKERTS